MVMHTENDFFSTIDHIFKNNKMSHKTICMYKKICQQNQIDTVWSDKNQYVEHDMAIDNILYTVK